MRNTFLFTLSMCAGFACVLNLAAEERTLTLQSCIDLAMDHNRSLMRRRNGVSSAEAQRRIGEADVFSPELTVSHDWTEDGNSGSGRIEANYLAPLGVEVEPFLDSDYTSGSSDPRSSSVGVTLRRRLFSAAERWRLRLPLTRAERELLQAQNTLRQDRRELRYDVSESFMAVQRVQNRLRVRGDRVTDAAEFLKITETRVKNGLAPRVDIVNAQINLNQAEADVLGEQTNLRNRLDSLLSVIGLPLGESIAIDPFDVTTVAGGTLDLAADMKDVKERHESLVNQKLDIAFAEIEMDIQKDRLKPRFDLDFTAQHNTAGDDFFGDRNIGSEPVTLGVTYTTTLDGKKRDKARLVQLELDQQDRQTRLIDAEIRLLVRLRSAHRQIDRLRARVKLDEQRLQAERDKLKATVVRYEDGNVDNLEVTRAKQTVDNAELNLIDTRIDLVLAIEEYRSLLPPQDKPQTELTPP